MTMKTLLFRESLDLVIMISSFMYIFHNNNVMFVGLFVLLLFFGYFYRLPKREKPRFDATIITAPSDGKVLQVSQTADGFHKVSVLLTITDVHIQWFPVDGVIKNIFYKKGSFNLAHILEKSDFNERMSTIIQNRFGVVRVDQIAGQVARRIVNWSISNSYVKRGNLMGMIKLSSRVDVYLPANKVRLFIKEGDRLLGKLTPIAKWIRKKKN